MQYHQPAASPTQQDRTGTFPQNYASDENVSATLDNSDNSCNSWQQQQQQAQYCSPQLCYGCGMKSVVQGGGFCSRRCQWVVNSLCPQCGKGKPDCNFVYCCRNCIHQSAQANWCTVCGVCQTNLSGSCCNEHCAGAQQQSGPSSTGHQTPPVEGGLMLPPVPSNNYSNNNFMPNHVPMTTAPQLSLGGANRHSHGGGGRNGGARMECRVMNSSEMSRSGLPAVFGNMWAMGTGIRIVAAIKLTAHAMTRKRYLSYRSIVENQMASQGMNKYGHGGEGNEQRRYFGVSLKCNLGRDSPSSSTASPMPPAAIGGANPAAAAYEQQQQQQQQRHKVESADFGLTSLRTCYDPSCTACCVVTRGFDMFSMGLGSHYSNTTCSAAAQFLEPSPTSNLRAMVVGRVVIGNPEVHVIDATTEPPFIQAPQDPTVNHSLVLTNNDTAYDGTYVFADEAVDPQYLVLFE